jgi:hypothetical protein
MHALSAWELLNVWERGWGQPTVRQALALLDAAYPDASLEALAMLSVGQRDGRLLTLREQLFGPRLVGVMTCPGCGERLELTIDVADIRAGDTQEVAHERGSDGEPRAEMTHTLAAADYEVRFRLPNSLDLATIGEEQDLVVARRQLLERCLVAARHDSREADFDQLPAEVVDEIVEYMARADPQADVQLDMTCPMCSHPWLAAFDIVSFLWSEIDAWARRTLRQVHILASAYGWREADILSISAGRRQLYLDMIGS